MDPKCIKCIYCKSIDTYCVQIRKNKYSTKKIIRCRTCKRKHTPDDGYKRYKHNSKIIKIAINLRKENYSLKEVCETLKRNFKIKVSRKTILDWETKHNNTYK